jgi:hypothetical protein
LREIVPIFGQFGRHLRHGDVENHVENFVVICTFAGQHFERGLLRVQAGPGRRQLGTVLLAPASGGQIRGGPPRPPRRPLHQSDEHAPTQVRVTVYRCDLIDRSLFSASSASESSSNESVNESESFYLHDPQEVIYNRVKDLFEATPQRQPLSALTGTPRPLARTVSLSLHCPVYFRSKSGSALQQQRSRVRREPLILRPVGAVRRPRPRLRGHLPGARGVHQEDGKAGERALEVAGQRLAQPLRIGEFVQFRVQCRRQSRPQEERVPAQAPEVREGGGEERQSQGQRIVVDRRRRRRRQGQVGGETLHAAQDGQRQREAAQEDDVGTGRHLSASSSATAAQQGGRRAEGSGSGGDRGGADAQAVRDRQRDVQDHVGSE